MFSNKGDTQDRWSAVRDDEETRPGEDYVQSVDRALATVEILGRDGWCGVTEIADELGVNKSTVFRILATLKRRNFVEQHPANQRYRLGYTMVRLANSVRSQLDLTKLARPVAERLSQLAEESVVLAVLDHGKVLNVDQVDLSSSAVSVNWSKRRSSVHATSTGKALLAHLPRETVEGILASPLEQFTATTITSPDDFMATLAKVRRQGYAYTLEEMEDGLNAVSAPILDSSNRSIAALCITAPAFRLPEARIHEIAPSVVEAATEISRGLGFVGDLADQTDT